MIAIVAQELLRAGAPASELEQMVLSRPCNGPPTRCEAIEMLRSWREEQRRAAGFLHSLLEWLKTVPRRYFYATVFGGMLLWRMRAAWREREQTQRPTDRISRGKTD